MKSVFFLSLMTVTSFAWSAEWKVVAETFRCKEKLQVLAKEGEKFVYVVDGNTKTKLVSESNEAFSDQNPKAMVYTNTHDKNLDDRTTKYTFTQPSVVDGNPAKLDVSMNGQKENCKMNLK